MYISDTYTCRVTHKGARGGAVGLGTILQTGRSRVQFLMVSLEFFIDEGMAESVANRNEYQGHLLGEVKAAGA